MIPNSSGPIRFGFFVSTAVVCALEAGFSTGPRSAKAFSLSSSRFLYSSRSLSGSHFAVSSFAMELPTFMRS